MSRSAEKDAKCGAPHPSVATSKCVLPLGHRGKNHASYRYSWPADPTPIPPASTGGQS